MSASPGVPPLLRQIPASLAIAASIVLSWDRLIQSLGQGSHYLMLGWWASLMGGFVLVFGILVPMVAVAVGAVGCYLLRVPVSQAPMDETRYARMMVGAFFMHAGACVVPGVLMWSRDHPLPNEHAKFDAVFGWTTGLLTVSLATGAATLCSRLVARHPVVVFGAPGRRAAGGRRSDARRS